VLPLIADVVSGMRKARCCLGVAGVVLESGVRRMRFHDMRHTAATLMLASGVQLNTVKEICGHASITTTMGYVHLLADSVRDAGLKFSLCPAETPAPIKPLLQIAR